MWFQWRKKKKPKEDLYLGLYRDGDWVLVKRNGRFFVGDLFKAIDSRWYVTIYNGSGSFPAEDHILRLATPVEIDNLGNEVPYIKEYLKDIS